MTRPLPVHPARTQAVVDRLERMAEQRRRLEAQIDDLRRAMGRLAGSLIDERGLTKSEVATRLRTSRARLDEMILRSGYEKP